MNIRSPVDYSAMFAALDVLMAADLPQMKLYCEIGQLVGDRPEKGAAAAAAKHLQSVYTDVSGFSPRNLRRMREFYHTYETAPEILAEAMTIVWTQNVVILEADLTLQEREWYIQAARQFGWSKLELQRKIQANTHLQISLDFTDKVCYTNEKPLDSENMFTERQARKLEQQLFETNVVTGADLLALSENVRNWEKRDCYRQLDDYLHSAENDRVCLLFGLRRTGKTTMLRQAVLDMVPEDAAKTAYIKATVLDTMAALNRDMKRLRAAGFRYVFLDEITLIQEFIDSAALFSDIYAAQGMKIVLSGTDSLGFWFALHQELYDRATAIHTTFIPYREHSRLLGINSIDEYIRYGGTLRAGELNFDDAEVNVEDASFRDDETTRRYIDTAICKNIQHSLACYEDGGHFRHLRSLYEAGELTGAINRVIEDMNHAFLASVLTKDFISHDLRLTARNLRKERDPAKQTEILDEIDTAAVTQRLMELLDIRNRPEQTVPITDTHVAELKEYLAALDLIVDVPIETTRPGAEPVEHILFTQPGMRYCQAQALVHSLMKDRLFLTLSERERNAVTERILEEVRGRMLEDIVLLETMKAADKSQRVFKLQFADGEFDMAVYDNEQDCCKIYEVKHSSQQVPAQYRHLLDEEKCRQTEHRFGSIAERTVLYRGKNMQLENGVKYHNVEEYLQSLVVDMAMIPESSQQLGPVM